MNNIQKKIVLIDPSCIMINSLYSSQKIIIDTLIIGSDDQIDTIKSKYNIANILTFDSINTFYCNQKLDLDYSIISTFRETELKVEHFLSRVTTDINSIQHIYYSALFYWIKRFKKNDIYGVISSNVEFGSTFDSVIFDVAKYYGKNVFIAEVGLSNGHIRTNQLFDYIHKKYIQLDLTKYGLKKVKKEDFFFNSSAKSGGKNYIHPKEPENNFIKSFIKNTLYNVGGFLLLTFPAVLLQRFKSEHHTFHTSWWTYLKNHIYIKKMSKYYNSLCSQFDSSKKYIYFPLHMEPEAATQNRTISSNQMIIIKTITENLPKGWILYVKEHPHQYKNLNKKDRYYYLTTINKFRTSRYYNEIHSITNVKLLNSNINSQEILSHAQGVVSINGTIILEALMCNKPILAFSQNTTPFINVAGIFDIKNFSQCKESLDLIKEGYSPNYQSVDEIIETYFYEIEDNVNNNYCLLIEDLLLQDDNSVER